MHAMDMHVVVILKLVERFTHETMGANTIKPRKSRKSPRKSRKSSFAFFCSQFGQDPKKKKPSPLANDCIIFKKVTGGKRTNTI